MTSEDRKKIMIKDLNRQNLWPIENSPAYLRRVAERGSNVLCRAVLFRLARLSSVGAIGDKPRS
jgi:hypothetical protein